MNAINASPLSLNSNSSDTDIGKFLNGNAFISTMQSKIDIDDFSCMFNYYKKSGENHLPIYNDVITCLMNISMEVYPDDITFKSLNIAKANITAKIDSIKTSLPKSRINEFVEALNDVVTLAIDDLGVKPKKKIRRFCDEQMTYLMTDSNTGYTKIGRSINPKFRESTLQSEKPTISLIATCFKDYEDALHKKYEHKRGRGEWFKLSDKDISDIVNDYNFNLIEL